MRLLACCSGRWKCGANRSDVGDQIDDLPGAVHRLERADAKAERPLRDATSAESSSSSDERGVEIAAVRAEVNAGQRDLLEAGGGDRAPTSRRTSASGTLLGCPRVDGMMQYEHGSAQPVCTRKGERRPAGDARLDRAPRSFPRRRRSAPRLKAETRRPSREPCRRWARRGRRSAARATSSGRASRSSRSRRCARRGSTRAIRRIVCRAP